MAGRAWMLTISDDTALVLSDCTCSVALRLVRLVLEEVAASWACAVQASAASATDEAVKRIKSIASAS